MPVQECSDSSVGGGVEVKPPSNSAHSQIIQTPTYTSAKTVFNPSNEQEGIETFQVILFLSFSFLNDSYNPFQGWRIQVKYFWDFKDYTWNYAQILFSINKRFLRGLVAWAMWCVSCICKL